MAAFSPFPEVQGNETPAQAFFRVHGRAPNMFELQEQKTTNFDQLSNQFESARDMAQQGFGSVGFSADEILSEDFENRFGQQSGGKSGVKPSGNAFAMKGSGGGTFNTIGGGGTVTGGGTMINDPIPQGGSLSEFGTEQGSRPIDAVASQLGMKPFQAFQLAGQFGDPQQVIRQWAVSGIPPNVLNQGGGSGDPRTQFGGGGGGTGGGGISGGTGGGGATGDPRGVEEGTVTTPELPGGEEYPFRATPGYNFRVQEGQRALENSAAARGGLMSGNHLKDLTRFGQGLAEQEFQNVFNMLGALRGGGATQNISNAAGAMGSNVGNLLAQGGQARAGGILGGNQAMQGGIGGALGILGGSGIFDRFFGGGEPSGGGSTGGFGGFGGLGG